MFGKPIKFKGNFYVVCQKEAPKFEIVCACKDENTAWTVANVLRESKAFTVDGIDAHFGVVWGNYLRLSTMLKHEMEQWKQGTYPA